MLSKDTLEAVTKINEAVMGLNEAVKTSDYLACLDMAAILEYWTKYLQGTLEENNAVS